MVDIIYASLPRRVPDPLALDNCKIVSHRGEHDNINIMENTLPAFEQVYRHGIWGIEFDIRWSKDLHPVVIHDADARRVFQSPLKIRDHTLAEIQTMIPQIPDLKQVIERYGAKLHMMIEIKQEKFPDIKLQRSRLRHLLKELSPAVDFHLLSLDPTLFRVFDIVPNSAMLPVAEFNLKKLSRLAIDRNYAGVCGQYLLLTNSKVDTHRHKAQKVGVGFVNSRACFYRELNRNIDWIFTNDAIKLNRLRNQLRIKYRPG